MTFDHLLPCNWVEIKMLIENRRYPMQLSHNDGIHHINVSHIVRSLAGALTTVFVLLYFIRCSVMDLNIVPTGSMIPTIVEGDQIIVNKLAYDFKLPFSYKSLITWDKPHRGDIVVFTAPMREVLMVKRVVGLPGDLVTMLGNRLYINGQPIAYEITDAAGKDRSASKRKFYQQLLIENLCGYKHAIILSPSPSFEDTFDPVIIPPKYYFLLGDNRDNSADSRYFGPVEHWRIQGRVSLVAASFNPEKDNRPRWKRFLTSLL